MKSGGSRMHQIGLFARKGLCSLLIAALTLVLVVELSYPVAAAPSAITLTSSVQTAFPTSMTFKVHAQSDSNVTQLRLHYRVNRQNFADVSSEGWAQFTPATSVDGQW